MSCPPDALPTRGADSRPSPSPPARRWQQRGLLLLVLLTTAAAAGWRYRITRPEYRLNQGLEAVRQADWETAEDIAAKLEAAGYPDHAHLLRGEGLYARHRPGPALAELNRIRDQGAIRLRAAALSGKCFLQLDDRKAAYHAFAFVVGEQPDDTDAHRGLAAIAYDLGQLGVAIDHLEQVARLDPGDARPHRLIGLIYKDMGQLPPAEAAYREALRRNPAPAADEEIRTELGETLMKQTRFADALAALDAEPPGGDEGPARLAVRAECLRGLGRPKEAADLLDRGLAKHETAPLYRLRGQLLLDAGDTPGATRMMERAVALAPAEYQSHYLLAKVYAGGGRKDDAARELARAEEIRQDLDRITALTREAMDRPWDAGVRLRLAALSDRLGNPQVAIMWRSAAAACAGN